MPQMLLNGSAAWPPGPLGFEVVENHPVASIDHVLQYSTASFSTAVLLLYMSRSYLRRRLPSWLRPFAPEEPPRLNARRSWSRWTFLLFLIAFLGLGLSTMSIMPAGSGHIQYPSRRRIVEVVPWLFAAFITALDRPVKTPRILSLLYLGILAASLASYSVRFLARLPFHLVPLQLASPGLCVLALLVIGVMPLRDPAWGAHDIGHAGIVPSSSYRSPEDDISLFGFWTVSWVYPLARLCRKTEIDEQDVWQLPFDFQHSRLYMAFRELEGKLLPCLIEANGLDLFLATALTVVTKVAEVSAIRLTSELYAALDGNDPREAYFWCLAMLCLDAVRQVCKTSSSWYGRKAYERSRGETFIALFRKLLTRAVPGSDPMEKGPDDGDTKSSSGQASNAKVVNLVRGDTYKISQQFWDFPKMVSQPIKVLVTMYFLIDVMGWSSAVGFALMALFLLVNSLLVKRLITLERARTAHSDKRCQAVAHFVEASRPLKLNGWTACWSERIMRFRDAEMRKRLQMSLVGAVISTVGVTGGAAYPFASIFLYTSVLRQGLPNNVIWPSLQLFAELEASVREAFDLLSALWQASIPVERVNKYMDEPDRDVHHPDEVNGNSNNSNKDIAFRTASFAWPATDKLVLHDIDLSLSKGLTVVRGKVGSGKSSLLLAALNELELCAGSLNRPDCPVAYAQQLPWLQNKTIRENVLFHHAYDPVRYSQTLHACALGVDLAALPRGDQTKLEEGGIGLSGGQKARVALARAIYSPSPILLLDDPLAALDQDTASTIVKRFLQGSLALGRTIVMVTHRDDLVLAIADKVIDMDGGRARVLTRKEIQDELAHPYHRQAEPSSVSLASSSSSSSKQRDQGSGAATPHPAGVTADMIIKTPGKDAPEEVGETGSVSMSLYFKYMRAGGWFLWFLLALAYSMSRICDISRARLLEAWGADSVRAKNLLESVFPGQQYWNLPDYLTLPDPETHPDAWLYVLACLSAGQIATHALAQLLLARICVNAARRLFKIAIDKVGAATFRYHDTTSTGQLKNRLISDMGMVDGGIVSPLEAFVFQLIALVMSVAAIASHQPALLGILVFVAGCFVYFFRLYVPVSRCLRRLEMRYLTPIIANIGVMQDGLVTIRALRVEAHFQDRHLDAVDDFQKQDHFFWSMAFWLDFRLSATSAVTRAALVAFMIWRGVPASAIGFVLTQTSIAMTAVQQLCERFAQLQLDAVSLERVNALSNIPSEPSGGRSDDDLPPDWPSPADAITFDDVTFSYAPDLLPPVLDKISFSIPGGSTCAVLGRTGSGKSTLANALLVTESPTSGSISIGEIPLRDVDRTALRNRITFIQQDPTLFPGTLRDNIDPEARFSDEACRSAIERVLGEGFGLETGIEAAGKNLSQGQRQLVGIARAVLRRSGLVVLDEATASIDRGTAGVVQRVLREELRGSTVVTIAHRVEAVEGADYVLRLEGGRVLECGRP